jgi:threonine dehydrogenase-like Zn-dependent dehydrogenase
LITEVNATPIRARRDEGALAWHGKRDVRAENVPEPTIEESTGTVVLMITTSICDSDLHLYEVLDPFMVDRDILGHEPMGIVEEVGT